MALAAAATERPIRTRRPGVHQSNGSDSMIAWAGMVGGIEVGLPGDGVDRGGAGEDLYPDRGGGVLGLVLAHLPLAAEEPERVGELGGPASGQVLLVRVGLEPYHDVEDHRRSSSGVAMAPDVGSRPLGASPQYCSSRSTGRAIRACASSRVSARICTRVAWSSGLAMSRRHREQDGLLGACRGGVEAEGGAGALLGGRDHLARTGRRGRATGDQRCQRGEVERGVGVDDDERAGVRRIGLPRVAGPVRPGGRAAAAAVSWCASSRASAGRTAATTVSQASSRSGGRLERREVRPPVSRR